MLHITQSH